MGRVQGSGFRVQQEEGERGRLGEGETRRGWSMVYLMARSTNDTDN
jgi:hypothetical protein